MKKFLGIIVFVVVSFSLDIFVPSQEVTNFAMWKEPRNVSSIPDWSRRMLVRDFRDLTGDARTKRLAEYLSELDNIVSDANVVPPTRYNAILAIGQLVSEEASPGNPPSAYSAALPYLVDVYQQADSPASLKYGALLGIVRHANCGIDSTQRENVVDLLLKTVKDEYGGNTIIVDNGFAAPFEPVIWDWFRQTALDGLSALKATGTNGNVIAELLLVMNQKSQELELFSQSRRIEIRDERKHVRQVIELASKVAKTLGDLDYKSTAVNAEAITDAFVRLSKAVSDVEYKIVVEILKQGKTSPDSMIQMGQIVIDMKTCTQSIAWGIRGGFLSAKPAENSFYSSLQNDTQATKQLDRFWAALTDFAIFLDEGNKATPQMATGENTGANAPSGSFKFDLPELRDALTKFSETLVNIRE